MKILNIMHYISLQYTVYSLTMFYDLPLVMYNHSSNHSQVFVIPKLYKSSINKTGVII